MSNARISIPEAEIEAFCRKWKIAAFRFFGSVLRDDFGPESDVDVLDALEPGVRWPWGGYGEMTDELEQILGRKVDLVECAAVEQSENYVRRRSILSGKPPLDRDDAHLLDILLAARQLLAFFEEAPEEWDTDARWRGAILWEVGQLARAAGRVSASRRVRLPAVPWEALAVLDRVIMPRSVPFLWLRIRGLVPEALPRLIGVLEDVVPAEEPRP
jgi:uncharacterized protein